MKIKLDENLGRRCVAMLREAGHDVATVPEQKLAGANDHRLIEICALEQRCLVSLDVDFSNPLRFPPANYSGIAVIRLSAKPNYDGLVNAIGTFAAALVEYEIDGALWIVEEQRIRVYKADTDNDV